MKINLSFNAEGATIHYAADELSSNIALLGLPITFFINSNYLCDYTVKLAIQQDLSAFGLKLSKEAATDDQFVCRFGIEYGEILGSNPRSVLLCIYALLRKIGFRFLRPGAQGMIVPTLTDIKAIFVPVTCSAAVRHRGVCIEGANSVENVLDFIEWLPKVGFNSFFVQFKNSSMFLQRWYEHTGNPTLAPAPLSESECQSADTRMTKAMQLRGILQHRVGHGWTAAAIGHECLGWQDAEYTPDEHATSLLAMINGKRIIFGGVPANTNLCYANPEVVQRLAECVTEYARENTYVDYLHFWIADGFNNVCECEQCQGVLPTDQYVAILNAIDAQLTANKLDVKIVFLLYHELLYAPLTARINNPERFVLMFAPISRTFEHSYPQMINKDVQPPLFKRNDNHVPVSVADNLAFLYQWQQVFAGDSFAYDYPLGRAHYGDFGYMKISEIIFNDIRALHGLGLNGYISCQELRCFSPTSLPNYVMGLALLDEELTYTQIASEYFTAAFGDKWQEVQAYLTQLSRLSDTDYFNGKTPRIMPALSAQLTQLAAQVSAFAQRLDRYTQEASEQTRIFWQTLKYHGEYSVYLAKALAQLAQGNTSEANAYYKQLKAYLYANELRQQASLDVFRLQEVAEHFAGFTNEA